MKKSYSLVLTTTGSQRLAEKIALTLVKRKLSACIQLLPIKSFYSLEGKLQKDKEVLVFIKSRSEKFPAIKKLIKKLHSYKVPEIVEIKIWRGSKDYLKWIDSCLK